MKRKPDLKVDGIALFAVPGTEIYFISKCAKLWRVALSLTCKNGTPKNLPGMWVTQRLDDKGYLVADLQKKPTAIHLILAKTFLGWEPGWETDHRNQDKLDNRLSNLRVAELRVNRYNNKARGYSWHEEGRKWNARITINRKLIHLGLFKTEEAAHAAYLAAKSLVTPKLTSKQ